MDELPEITVLQLPKFKIEATAIIGAEGIDAVATHLAEYPEAGVLIPGFGRRAKTAVGCKGKGKRGGSRIIYVYVVVSARVYLMRCYAKNVKSDLTPTERGNCRN